MIDDRYSCAKVNLAIKHQLTVSRSATITELVANASAVLVPCDLKTEISKLVLCRCLVDSLDPPIAFCVCHAVLDSERLIVLVSLGAVNSIPDASSSFPRSAEETHHIPPLLYQL